MKSILQNVAALELPNDDFAIFGSGPLLVRGVIEHANDIDILCRGAAWEYARNIGEKIHLSTYDIDIISIDDGRITLGRSWGIGNFDVDELIDSAEVIDGLPFVRLEHVIAYKLVANRAKDREHLAALRATGLWQVSDRDAE